MMPGRKLPAGEDREYADLNEPHVSWMTSLSSTLDFVDMNAGQTVVDIYNGPVLEKEIPHP